MGNGKVCIGGIYIILTHFIAKLTGYYNIKKTKRVCYRKIAKTSTKANFILRDLKKEKKKKSNFPLDGQNIKKSQVKVNS